MLSGKLSPFLSPESFGLVSHSPDSNIPHPKSSTTFNVDDWITHTPKSVLAKNFGLPESVFGSVPSPNPYIRIKPAAKTSALPMSVSQNRQSANNTRF